MSGWSRTVKPSADKTIAANKIFAVDAKEIAVTPIPSHVGWVKRTTVGNRVKTEVLVAMKTPPTDAQVTGDDTEFPDTVIAITAHPQDAEVTSPDAAVFSVTATATPTATLTYQWQVSTDNGGSASNITGETGATLNIASTDPEYVDGNQFRVVVTAAGTGGGDVAGSDDSYSNFATLTVNS